MAGHAGLFGLQLVSAVEKLFRFQVPSPVFAGFKRPKLKEKLDAAKALLAPAPQPS